MDASIGREDVVLFVNSERIVKVLPPDFRDRVTEGMHERGYYTFPGAVGNPAMHGGFIGDTVFNAGNFGGKPIISHELTEEEQETVRTVLRMVHAKGMTLHLVDVGKESHFRRIFAEHLHHLREFPVLIRHDGRRLDGFAAFTPEGITKLLS